MIPASHVLSGYLAGRLLRAAARGGEAPRNPLRDPLVLTALAGSVFPDWDVIPGLLYGVLGSSFHRGPTHSPVGVVLQALVLGPAAYLFFQRWAGRWKDFVAPPLSWRMLTLAAGLGLATHAFWDFLNPWGIALLWPLTRQGYSAQLIHEGNLHVLALLAVTTAFVAMGRLRLGYGLLFAALAVGLPVQFWWRQAIEQAAREQFAERQFFLYPAAWVECPWQVLTKTEREYAAYCAGWAPGSRLQEIRRVERSHPPEADQTRALPEVEEFLEDRNFPFAEVRKQAGGKTVVLWRDLRDALVRGDEEAPTGLYVTLAADGRVAAVDYRWQLRFWFF